MVSAQRCVSALSLLVVLGGWISHAGNSGFSRFVGMGGGESEKETAADLSRMARRECLLQPQVMIGQTFTVQRSTDLRVMLHFFGPMDSRPHLLERRTMLQFEETVLSVEQGRPTRVRRRYDLAQSLAKDPMGHGIAREDLPLRRTEAEYQIVTNGSLTPIRPAPVGNRGSGKEPSDFWFSTLPHRPASLQEKWAIHRDDLQRLLRPLEGKWGRAELQFTRVEEDEDSGEKIAHLEGNFSCHSLLESQIEGTVQGEIHEEFLLHAGFTARWTLRGKLDVDTHINEFGLPLYVLGEGTIEIIETRKQR